MSSKPVSLGMGRLSGEEETPPAPPTIDDDPPPPQTLDAPLTDEEMAVVRDKMISAAKTCEDPELNIDIWQLGLIYDMTVSPEGAAHVRMTLTTPACPVAGALVAELEQKIRRVENVTSAKVDLVWDPPWDKNRMSEAARLQLGMEDW